MRAAEDGCPLDQGLQIQDSSLTKEGIAAAEAAGASFPRPDTIGLIISSPTPRAVQTALTAFPHILDRRYYDATSRKGVESGVDLLISPLLQPVSVQPRDTNSSIQAVKELMPKNSFNYRTAGEDGDWVLRTGLYTVDDEAVAARAATFRDRAGGSLTLFADLTRKNLVVLTHGSSMKALVQDEDYSLSGAGLAEVEVIETQPDH
jgi:broad specificity phosphatase PhoE